MEIPSYVWFVGVLFFVIIAFAIIYSIQKKKISNLEKKIDPEFAHIKRKVSLKWQTVMVLVPILSFYTFYRIKKLRLGLIIAVSFGVTHRLVNYAYDLPFSFGSITSGFLTPAPDMGYLILYYVIMFSWFIVDIILIRQWSKEWNNTFESN